MKTISILFIIITLFLTLTSCCIGQEYYTITPGRGINGMVELGADMGRIFEVWGNSDTVSEGYGVLIYDYYNYKLSFATEIYTNRVAIIYINTYIYRTSSNIGVGSSLDDVLSAYGRNYRLQEKTSMGGYAIFYDSRGIGFGIDNNTVVSMAIYYKQ